MKVIMANQQWIYKATDVYLQNGVSNPCGTAIPTSCDEQQQNLMLTLKTSTIFKNNA